MSTKNQNNVSNEQDQTQRVGLWVGLGVAALTALGVLGLAFYTNYQEGKPNQEQSIANSASSNGSQQPEIVSSVPATEAQAASLAVANSDQQINGMTAPAEENDDDTHAASDVAIAASQIQAASQVASAPAAPSPAQTILANETAASQTQVIEENGVVKFTFATGKSDVAANTLQALNGVVDGVKNGQKAVILSYAGVEANERLAKERAFAVRSVLLAAGVPESSIEIKEPATADNDSRRVEVVLQ